MVLEVQNLRYTPAGIPVLNLLLEHESSVTEMDAPRRVKLQVRAVAFGVLAETLSRQALASVCRFAGFMAHARNGKGLVFHIQDFSKT